MKFQSELIPGRLVKRYKRFFADVELDNGETVVAHVPNTGSMLGLKDPGTPCLLSPANNPDRKLKFTLEFVKAPKTWVGVNTGHPNKLVKELWGTGTVPHWSEFTNAQTEVKIHAKTRLDLVLWNKSEQPELKKVTAKNLQPPLHFIEVKNVTMSDQDKALFPDAVTERGQKHLTELIELMEQGYSCEMVYAVQRSDCNSFSPANHIDPVYADILRKAVDKGLRVSAFPMVFESALLRLAPNSLKIEL